MVEGGDSGFATGSAEGAGMRERAHLLRPARVCSSKEARVAAELADVVGREEAQTEWMMSVQGRELGQPGSNLKILDRGIVVVTCMMRGTWSGREMRE